MPVYGEAKVRNMIRSVLPSTGRKGVRDTRRLIHKTARQKAKQDILRGDETRIDYSRGPIKYLVRDRREGDKVAPIMRWAPARVAHLPVEDRLPYMRALLPNNKIGRHAYGHIKYADGMGSPPRYSWGYHRREEVRKLAAEKEQGLIVMLRHLLATRGEHGRFNKAMKESRSLLGAWETRVWDYNKRKYVACDDTTRPVRMLGGLHDIEDFAADIYSNDSDRVDARRGNPHWRRAVESYLGTIPTENRYLWWKLSSY